MSEQIAVRIPDELAESLEDLVARGRFDTKAEAIRSALESLIDSERRRRVGELIVRGYLQVPQAEDDGSATAAGMTLRSMDAEERELGLEW
jgi:Arc/MetJ-type ribon-helix-helix transcriptional regulator